MALLGWANVGNLTWSERAFALLAFLNVLFDPISGADVVRMTGSISTREHQAIRFAQV